MANSKTTNYLVNYLFADYSKKRGGHLGFIVDEHDVLMEAAIMNVALVYGDELVVPKWDKILQGTTMRKYLEMFEAELKEKKEICGVKKVVYRDIKYDEIFKAQECFEVGADMCVPIVELDDKPIGSGK